MAARRCLVAAGLVALLATIIVAIAVPLSLKRNSGEKSTSSASSLELETDAYPSSTGDGAASTASTPDAPPAADAAQDGTHPGPTFRPSLSPTTQMPTQRPSPRPSEAANVEEAECEEYSDNFNVCIDNGVPYYHCNQNQGEIGTDILLLHGASFTKENWRRKGIIEEFCDHVTVAASDLSVSADSNVLMAMLDRLQRAGQVRLPLTIVTPSASGRSIVSWIRGATMEDMSKYVSIWVPVAPYSVLSATDSQLRSLSEHNIGVLAINGDGDRSGRQVSERLVDLADADMVELEGGHAVYLQSPNEFVGTVLNFMV